MQIIEIGIEIDIEIVGIEISALSLWMVAERLHFAHLAAQRDDGCEKPGAANDWGYEAPVLVSLISKNNERWRNRSGGNSMQS